MSGNFWGYMRSTELDPTNSRPTHLLLHSSLLFIHRAIAALCFTTRWHSVFFVSQYHFIFHIICRALNPMILSRLNYHEFSIVSPSYRVPSVCSSVCQSVNKLTLIHFIQLPTCFTLAQGEINREWWEI